MTHEKGYTFKRTERTANAVLSYLREKEGEWVSTNDIRYLLMEKVERYNENYSRFPKAALSLLIKEGRIEKERQGKQDFFRAYPLPEAVEENGLIKKRLETILERLAEVIEALP